MPDALRSPTALPRASDHRLPALDAMRGLVMVLMAVDHVDAVVNPRHANADGTWMGDRGPLSAPDFLTRWCSHLCAPTFVFLAGAAVALAAARAGTGPRAHAFDRHLAVRAGVLLTIEIVLLSTCFRVLEGGFGWAFASPLPVFLQVIYAIGLSLLLLVPLRRLPAAAQAALAAAVLVACDLLHTAGPDVFAGRLAALLLFDAGIWSRDGQGLDVVVLYPVLPWLAVLLLGHAVGQRLTAAPLRARDWLAAAAGCAVVFVVLRFADGFGNLGMHRRDDGVLGWLHCSKYPPSLTYLAMELGLMALCLAAFTAGTVGMRVESTTLLRVRPDLVTEGASGVVPAVRNRSELQRGSGVAHSGGSGNHTVANSSFRGRVGRALLVLGRVPLFFYLLHLLLIALLAGSGVLDRRGSWLTSWIVAFALVAACLPLCSAYARYKRSGAGWTRYL